MNLEQLILISVMGTAIKEMPVTFIAKAADILEKSGIDEESLSQEYDKYSEQEVEEKLLDIFTNIVHNKPLLKQVRKENK